MAIVIEEEKKSSVSWISVLVWIVILGIIGLAAYYLFFYRPELIPITVPDNFKNTEELSRIDLNLNILEDPVFKSLKAGVQALNPQTSGRVNPFLGF
jgi:hypothetical protein